MFLTDIKRKRFSLFSDEIVSVWKSHFNSKGLEFGGAEGKYLPSHNFVRVTK